MGTLHLVHKAAAWEDCKPLLAPGDAVLLIEDGVYAARRDEDTQGRGVCSMKAQADVERHALTPDLRARGLLEDLPNDIHLASFADFVNLVAAHERVVTWSR